MIVGSLIKAARVAEGRSQIEVAKKAKVHAQYISNVERGRCVLAPKRMKMIARYLKIPQRTLLDAAANDYRQRLWREMQ